MLTKKQAFDAVRYNMDKSGTLYAKVDLPWPWSDVWGDVFVWATALFQKEYGMVVDGKLGVGTLATIKKAANNTSVETPSKKMAPPPHKGLRKFKHSNAIIVDGARVQLPDEFLADDLTASNYMDDEEPHFKHRERSVKLVHFVLHETCGNTAKGCMNTLLKRGYGVQLILAPSGHLSCHGDLVRDRMIHANQLNDTSFGVEIVNPYAPKYVRDKAIFFNTIPAQWWTWCPDKKDRRYVTPTPSQMAAIRLLAPWLCEITGVPYRFPTKGLNKRKRKIDGLTLKPKAKPGPGVVCHGDFSKHSDGRYILENLIGRL